MEKNRYLYGIAFISCSKTPQSSFEEVRPEIEVARRAGLGDKNFTVYCTLARKDTVLGHGSSGLIICLNPCPKT